MFHVSMVKTIKPVNFKGYRANGITLDTNFPEFSEKKVVRENHLLISSYGVS